MAVPMVSIIVVSYNANDALGMCMESLRSQTNQEFECIVVDNGSSELLLKDESLAKYIMLDKNYGPSYARNCGVDSAVGEIVAFLDDDSVASRDFVDVLIQTFRDDDIVAVRGKVLGRDRSNIYNLLPGHYDLGDDVLDSPLTTECNCAARRGDFLAVGGFDRGLYGHEGVDLSYRLACRGRQLYIPEAIVYHDYGDNLRHFIRKQYRHGYNKSMLSDTKPEVMQYDERFVYPMVSWRGRVVSVREKMLVYGITVLAMIAEFAGTMRYRRNVRGRWGMARGGRA